MKNFFAMEGPLFTFMNKVGGIIAVSFFWILGCIPLVTIGASTAAAYYAMVKVVRKETGHVPAEFWRAFKRNLKYGIIVSVILLVVVALMVFDTALFNAGALEEGSLVATLWGAGSKILLFFMAIISFYLFPVMSRFDIKLKDMISMAFFMSIRYFYITILLAIELVALAFINFGGFIFGSVEWVFRMIPMVFVTPGLYFFLSSFSIESVLRKYMPPPEEGVDPEELQWYYK